MPSTAAVRRPDRFDDEPALWTVKFELHFEDGELPESSAVEGAEVLLRRERGRAYNVRGRERPKGAPWTTSGSAEVFFAGLFFYERRCLSHLVL